MLINPADYIDHLTFGDALCYSSVEEMWDNKLAETIEYGPEFIEWLRATNGYQDDTYECPTIGHYIPRYGPNQGKNTVLWCDGHHRFLAAFLLDIPLFVYFDCEVAECGGNCLKNLAQNP